MSNTIRIRTNPGGLDKYIKIPIEQEFDFIEILSLRISQEEAYRNFCADYGVITGRVFLNRGFGIPNAKVSVFIPIDDIDKEDPLIYQPKNCLETLKSDYIFHTHPKTPYIGSRIKNGIIYEFPSISDIIHFVDHHNNGKLLGSLVITPEGLYIIHKYYFNREKIKVDIDILIDKLYDIYHECYQESMQYYHADTFNNVCGKGAKRFTLHF